MSEPSFWDDSEKANQVIQKNNELKAIYDTFHKMELAHEETSLLFEMYKEEPDEEVHAEIVDAIESLEKDLQQYELSMLLNGP